MARADPVPNTFMEEVIDMKLLLTYLILASITLAGLIWFTGKLLIGFVAFLCLLGGVCIGSFLKAYIKTISEK